MRQSSPPPPQQQHTPHRKISTPQTSKNSRPSPHSQQPSHLQVPQHQQHHQPSPHQTLPAALHQIPSSGLPLANGPMAYLRNQSLMSMLPPPPASSMHPTPAIPINAIGHIGQPSMAHMAPPPSHHGLIMPPPPPIGGNVVPPGMLGVLPPPPAHSQKHLQRPIEAFENHLGNVISNAILDGNSHQDHIPSLNNSSKKRPASNSSADSSESMKIAAMINGPKYPVPTSTTQIPTLNLYHNYVSRKPSCGEHSGIGSSSSSMIHGQSTTPPVLLQAPPPSALSVCMPVSMHLNTTTTTPQIKPLIRVNSELISSHIDAVLDSVAAGNDTLTTDSEMFAKSQEKNYRRKRKSKDDFISTSHEIINPHASIETMPKVGLSIASDANTNLQMMNMSGMPMNPGIVYTSSAPMIANPNTIKRKRIVNRSQTKPLARIRKERLKPISLVRSNPTESWLINKDEYANQAMLMSHCVESMSIGSTVESHFADARANIINIPSSPPQSPLGALKTSLAPVIVETPKQSLVHSTSPIKTTTMDHEQSTSFISTSSVTTVSTPVTTTAASTPTASTTEDRYSGYDKHFKKKFFAQRSIALNNKAAVSRTPQQRAILEEKLGKFNKVN